jgi:hypothetical protein
MLANKTHPQGRIRWKDVVIPMTKESKSAFYQRGIAPTVRGMFYVLISLNIIAATTQNYKGLDRANVAVSCSRVRS